MSSFQPSTAVRAQLLTRLCYGSMMALSIGMNLLPVFLTELSVEFGGEAGLSKEQLGRLSAWCFSGLVTGILVTGPLADRWGAKLFALFGNVVTAASLAAMAWAPGYGLLCGALFSMGLGAGMTDMILSPIVSVLNPERRTVALNWLHSFYCVGAVMTIGVGTVTLSVGLGWSGTCLLLLPLPLVLAVMMAPLRFPSMVGDGADKSRSDSVAQKARMPMSQLVRRGWFVVAMAAIFLGGATEAGMAQWLPLYAEKSLGYPVWIGGLSLLLFSVAMTAGRMIVGMAGRRMDPFVMMAWGCGFSVVLFWIGAFFPSASVALLACIAAGFTGSCLWPTTLAVTADRYPNGGASMFGMLAALGNAGGIFMPWLVGMVADWRDLHWGLAISAVAPFIMVPMILWMRRAKA
ncbi:fucose permease [Ereboglobus sp. PH5-10]|uniref:MFS transporter n=1 Tax=Ereboglobus sp. PH5-10 TaxID=2940629 RepID=UPI0024063676|nr:MFS transporter [Ereboglobus sp. PH5-10]MDF9826948.1 fucose permease [Ereboglobus sp. PH5-10]